MASDVGSVNVSAGAKGFFPPPVSVLPAVPVARVDLRPSSLPTLDQRMAAVPGLSRAELQAADGAAMRATLQGLLAALKNRPAEEIADGEMHQDGTLRISSLEAVWLLGVISEAHEGRKLVNLSRVKDLEALRSLGGLTRLLIGVVGADAKRTAA